MAKIPELLFNTDKLDMIDHHKLWGDNAFYNFVQRPMNHHEKESPKPDDFVAGWTVFAGAVRIIQPSHSLFIGVTAANFFDLSMASQNLSFEKHSRAPQVGGVWPRVP